MDKLLYVEDDLEGMTLQELETEVVAMRERAERVRRRLGMNMTFQLPMQANSSKAGEEYKKE